MSTSSDICSDFTADAGVYPKSVQLQLLTLAEWIYFTGGNGNGDPFDPESNNPYKGIVAIPSLTEDDDYFPNEAESTFYTPFDEGDLIIKALENKTIFKSTGGVSGTTGTYSSGVGKTSLLISGNFIDFDLPSYDEDGIRQFIVEVPVCYKMVLIGNFDSMFLTPLSPGPGSGYGPPHLVDNPGIPGIIPDDDYGWFPDTNVPEDERTPYWVKPGGGTSQTLPCISPRRLKLRQWGFSIDLKTTNSTTKRSA